MSVNRQKKHYDTIHDEYEKHYFDVTSLAYRKCFIFDELLRGFDVRNAAIADVACGSGGNTTILAEYAPSAQFTGYDISARACDSYCTRTGFQALCVDFTEELDFADRFDIVVVVGGLHHMISNLEIAGQNIFSMLKPGGILLAYEPNAGFLFNKLRNLWYVHDKYFDAQTERPLAQEELVKLFSGSLELIDSKYLGGPAYFLILNSLIFRLPLFLKRPLASILFSLESHYNRISWHRAFPAFISRWKKI